MFHYNRLAIHCFVGCILFAPLLFAVPETEQDSLSQPGSIIKRFVDPLTRQEYRPIRPILNSDEEHASSMGPVLSPGKAVYIRQHYSQKPQPEDISYALEDGRLFVNHEAPYDALKMPMLKIRPVDGKTRIPFLVRTSIRPFETLNTQTSVYLLFRLPAIFAPRFDLRRVSMAGRRLQYQTTLGPDEGGFTVTIPISDVPVRGESERPVEIVMEGTITLADYQVLPREDFAKSLGSFDRRLNNMARLMPTRDCVGNEEEEILQGMVREIQTLTSVPYEQLLLAHRFTSTKLTYFQNNMQRTAVQVLNEGLGDCDDYSRLMVALLRGLGIPSRMAIGFLYDFNSSGSHAWVEAALNTRKGKPHWFICDPTLAGASENKDMFVQFKNRIYLYPLRFEVKIHNLAADYRTEILLNWSGKSKMEELPDVALPSLINTFNDSLGASFDRQLAELSRLNLLLPRQFLYSPASCYVLADRAIEPNSSHLMMLLDAEERVVAELAVSDDDHALDSPADLQILSLLKDAYLNLKQVPFGGSEARHCLELTYYRDRHTDRLQRVRLRVSRYLVEQHLRTIIESFRKTGLLTDGESSRIISLHTACSGKNMYYLQELARRRPSPPPEVGAAPPPTLGTDGSDGEMP
jgi:hypothetical protein